MIYRHLIVDNTKANCITEIITQQEHCVAVFGFTDDNRKRTAQRCS